MSHAKIIAVANHKGGVGKTTTSKNLGAALARKGKKVLLVDNDPQTNLTMVFGIQDTANRLYQAYCHEQPLPVENVGENLDLVPASKRLTGAEKELLGEATGMFKLRTALKVIKDNYDYVIIDCPPSLNILTNNALMAASELLIATQPAYFSSEGLQDALRVQKTLLDTETHPNLKLLGILFTLVDLRTSSAHAIMEEVRKVYGAKVFKTFIRSNAALSNAASHRKDIFSFNKHSHGAEDYEALANEILQKNG